MQNLTDDELSTLKSAKTEDEWNATCDSIKRARGGQYPPDWDVKVIKSGVISDAQRRFS